MARREDKELARLMDQFVCVRVVQAWGLDLSIFQFDWRATWAMFLMNADKEVYARFSARKEEELEGLRATLEGVLELHKNYPANKGDLAGKRGLPFPWKSPEEMPAIVEKAKFQPARSKKGCVHCHNVDDAVPKSYKTLGKAPPERFLALYPTTQQTGFTLDLKSATLVTDVAPGRPADKAGLKAGDRILRLGGQPILSVADARWALWSAEDIATIKIEIDRGGAKSEIALTLPAGWRTR